jgi:hypothetical protein
MTATPPKLEPLPAAQIPAHWPKGTRWYSPQQIEEFKMRAHLKWLARKTNLGFAPATPRKLAIA